MGRKEGKKVKEEEGVVEEEVEVVEEEDSLSVTITDEDTGSETAEDEEEDDSDPETTTTAVEGKSPNKKQKLTWIQKKKKGIASRAAGSSIGSALFKKNVDKDTQSLINSLCEIIEKEKGKKEAKNIKKEILKVAVKILLLYEEKKVTEDSFQTLIFSFRRICSSVRNAYHARSLNEATAQRIRTLAQTLYTNLEASLQGLVTLNTMERIQALIDYVFNPAFLVAATKYDKEFQQIAMVLAFYLEASSS